MGLPRWVGSKESAYSAGAAEDVSSIPGSGRSPGRGNSNPLQYSCLGNPMDRGAWRATVHGIIKICTELSMHTCVHTHTHTQLLYNVMLVSAVKHEPAGSIHISPPSGPPSHPASHHKQILDHPLQFSFLYKSPYTIDPTYFQLLEILPCYILVLLLKFIST